MLALAFAVDNVVDRRWPRNVRVNTVADARYGAMSAPARRAWSPGP
jgi:hypothetical protein